MSSKKNKVGLMIMLGMKPKGKHEEHEKKERKDKAEHKKEMPKDRKPMHKEKDAPKGKFKMKMEKAMHDFKEGEMHSGSKNGPVVKNPKQAIAISLSQARKAAHMPKRVVSRQKKGNG